MKLSPGQARVLLYLYENSANGKGCYRYVREIAEAAELSSGSVTRATTRLVQLGIISREQMWELDAEGEPDYVPRLLTEGEAYGREHYYPGGNHYKVLQPAAAKALVDGSLCKPTQLELPFATIPPIELTILAPRARFYDRKIEPVEVPF